MKFLTASLLIFTLSAFAQDATTYLNNFDNKIYSLKLKGLKDLVFDIESSKLTKQMNDQQIFGKVENLYFRIYWTSSPERLEIDVVGLPEGFKEIKEELKQSVLPLIDNIFPQTMVQRFSGYKISTGPVPKTYLAQDSTGIAPVPSYNLKFDDQDKLFQIEGVKPIGTLLITPKYEKESSADGKLVLKSLETVNSENGQVLTTKKLIDYQSVNGFYVPDEVEIMSTQKSLGEDSKSVSFEDKIEFKNFKLNSGDALKHFLANAPKP